MSGKSDGDADRADFSEVIRADLHCHSCASNEASEAVLNAIDCPECYSTPDEVYEQATRRGMDFVALTDHDSLDGVLTLADRDNVIVGEELSCWFPEDGCKMHVLVWGITPPQHEDLQAMAQDIYKVAAYIEENHIAHSVAHPLYRQNDKLERWHVERLVLLFKGFEVLNGAHSALHRIAFEPVLNKLTRDEIQRLSNKHMIAPRWPEPWFKARTGGSDDHGLLNIGRTWTEFPAGTRTVSQILQCLREGTCRPGGEAGTSIKLAHNFFGVAVRYYGRKLVPAGQKPNLPTLMMQTFVGERQMPSGKKIIKMIVKDKLKDMGKKILKPFGKKKHSSANLMGRLFMESARDRLGEFKDLRSALKKGLPPLGEHKEMFRLVSTLNRDMADGIVSAMEDAVRSGRFTGIFDGISAALAQQFVLLPYYFSFFHQNRERHLFRRLTGHSRDVTSQAMKIGLFTDTLDDINGVGRFIRDMGEQAMRKQRSLVIHTCCSKPRFDLVNRKNFEPMLSRRLPFYPELELNLPPVPEILEWADRQQFDAIHVSTPGAMGLCGWLVAKMLHIPILSTYHTDFPAYVEKLSGDYRLTAGTTGYMKWFYAGQSAVFSRSREYQSSLLKLGVPEDRLTMTLPGINTDKFNGRHRDEAIFARLGIKQPRRVMYAGRVSHEKNLKLLVRAFKMLCQQRNDTALVVAGDGPYLKQMREELRGLPAYFLGYQPDGPLGVLYASSDLFVFPSRTDTLGQVVMEAQASGLPVLVSDEGGPKEMMDDGVTGQVIPGEDPALWCKAMVDLLDDEPRRQRMARTAPGRINRFSQEKTFEAFWEEHFKAVQAHETQQQADEPVSEMPASAAV